MAERPDLAETWRRVMEANLRYYEGLIGLSANYLGAVVGALGSLRTPDQSAHPLVPGDPGRTASRANAPAPALVLEAESGSDAMGAFLVENHLAHRVAAPIVVSAFRDPAGLEVEPALKFEPQSIALEPGEQLLVRVSVRIEEQHNVGTAYRGEVSIPGLSDSRVRLVIRRRQGGASGATGPEPPSGRRSRRLPPVRSKSA